MDVRRELRPMRDMVAAFAAIALVALLVARFAPPESPSLHTILDSGIFVLSGVLAMLLWDMGWRQDNRLAQLAAVCFCVAGLFDLVHALTAVELNLGAGTALDFAQHYRPSTWPPSAYVLPIGLTVAFLLRRAGGAAVAIFAVALGALGVGLLVLFSNLPRFSPPVVGITRPTLLLVPLIWVVVIALFGRRRDESHIARIVTNFALIALVSNCFIIFSHAPADFEAMVSHVGKLFGRLYLLTSLMKMGTVDTARRMRTERELRGANQDLEQGLRERNAQLESAITDLRAAAAEREQADLRTQAQLERLQLLRQITHAVGERQDLASIFQAVVRRLEDNMPVDFAAICSYETVENRLTVSRLGVKSSAAATALGWSDSTEVDIGTSGLSRCLHGTLVYEPDTAGLEPDLPRRFADSGLRSLVAAPITFEHHGGVSGVLLVARAAPHAFSSGECEFLAQLCSQVALAADQAHLHSALQHAYDDIRNTQQAVMQQERLRALGQMASGIAHDVNNAMTPVTIYLEALLDREPGLSVRGREHLETMQRSLGDVTRTIARMGEFYRRRDPQLELLPVNVNVILAQIPDLTRARWSDIAQAQGVTIALKVEPAPDSPTVLAVESELREALINLVLNAADSMANGGTIVLRARHVVPSGPATTGQIAIEVVDQGSGMDEETRQHCLEPFFTTKGERGTGLGLAMVYGIAERHSATLEIESEPGKGTLIRLLFAAAPDNAPASTTLRRLRAINKLRVLVVDDDPTLLRSLRDALEFDGHDVHISDSGRAGIDAFRASVEAGRPFPVVITDLGMPNIDGRQVASSVKNSHADTRVVMLTGWGQRMSETDELPAGVDRLLGKPPNMWQLRDALAGLAEA